MRTVIRLALLMLLADAFFAPRAFANVTVTAQITPATVAVGEAFQLEVRVRSTGLSGAGKLVVPQSPHLRQAGHSTSESMSLMNGSANRERVEIFTYVATQAGKYTFQGLGVRSGSTFIAGPVVSVDVQVPAPVAPQPPASAQSPSQGGSGIEVPSTGDDIFVTAHADKTKVHIGEPVLYTFRFYFRVNPESPTYDAPDFSGFQTYDLGQTKQPLSMQVRGQTYEYFDLRTLLYPLRTGDLTIGPGALIFRSSFFFTREHRRQTKPVTIRVESLPEAPPANFHGAVGNFSLRSTKPPPTSGLQDPLSLHLTVAGVGNFASVGAPEAVSSGAWRLFPGRVTTNVRASDIGVQGEKTFELLLQPPQAGRQTLPSFQFSYFDTSEERYVTLESKPGEINVTADGSASRAGELPVLALRPARLELGEPAADPLGSWRALLWLLPLPVVGLMFLAGGSAVQRRMRSHTPADRLAAGRRKWNRELDRKDTDAAGLLKALDAWLHEVHGFSASASEEEITARFGEHATGLLLLRRRLQGAVFGGSKVPPAEVQRGLRAWLKKSGLAMMILSVFLGGAAAVRAADEFGAQALFNKGHQAQMAGEYGEAVRLYRRTGERAGTHVNLLYNLAGAAWRAGQPGLARLAIERAYALSPRDEDVAANRELIAGAVAKLPASQGAAAPGKVTFEELGWLTMALYAVLTLLLLTGWYHAWARWGAVLVLLLLLPVAGNAAYLYQVERRDQPGVVWAATNLHDGAGETSAEIAPLPAGELAHVVERRPDWLRVKTRSGLGGWMPAQNWRPLGLLSVREELPE